MQRNQTTALFFAVCLGLGINAAAGPNIVMQPANQRTCSGANVMFSVYSDSTHALSYQWLKSGNNIAGATDARLVLRNVTAGDVDSYSVLVSDGPDTTVSSNATLTLYADGNVMPSTTLLSSELVSLRRIKAVAFGYNHGLALRYDGKVLTFGTPINGQYQGAYNIFSYLPPGLTNACAIAVDEFSFGMALEPNGRPRVWSYEASREIPVPAEAHDVVDIAATSSSALALRADGTVVCWQFITNFSDFIPDPVTDAVAISANSQVVSVLRRDGTVVEWNQFGMIQFTNDVTNVCKVVAGNVTSVAMLQDGEVISWSHGYGGYNSSSQTNVVTTLPAPPSNIVELVPDFLQALISDGSMASLQFSPFPGNCPIGFGTVNHVCTSGGGYTVIRQTDTPVIFDMQIEPQATGMLPSLVRQSVKVAPGQAIKIAVVAAGRAPLSYQWFKDSKPVAGATSSTLQLRGLTTESGLYSVQVRNRAGATMSQTFAVYVQQPALTVSGSPSVQTTNDTVHFDGTYPVGNTLSIGYPTERSIPSRGGVTNYSNATPPTPTLETNGSTVSWSIDIPLKAGTNWFSFSTIGLNLDASITREVYRVATSAISVVANGHGVVVPNLDGQELEVGKTYSVRARAGAGSYFAGWSESLGNSIFYLGTNVSSPTLTFTMSSNLVLTANFNTNQFPQLKGAYHGLVYAFDGIEHDTSGYIELQVGGSGSFSGRLLLGGTTYRFGGSFLTSTAVNYVGSPGSSTALYLPRSGKAPLYMWLQINGASIIGYVTDNYSSSGIIADQSIYNTNQAAQYTLGFLGGGGGDTNRPFGSGYATVTVDARGNVTMVGSLADGTAISQSTGVSSVGAWPLYVPLYNGKGSLISWVNLVGPETFDDPMSWSRPADPKGGLFAAGFTNESTVVGSGYSPAGNLFDATTGSIVVDSADNSVSFLDQCTISGTGAFTIEPSVGDHLQIKVNRATGTFSGSFVAPDNQQLVPVHGVVLQSDQEALGYYLRTNQSGSVGLTTP